MTEGTGAVSATTSARSAKKQALQNAELVKNEIMINVLRTVVHDERL